VNVQIIYRKIKGKDYKITCERRDYKSFNYSSEFSRSNILIECPFCNNRIRAYVWSLCGCGKKCACGAIHSGSGETFKEIKREVIECREME
jgi:hypothetical protein